MCKCIALPLDLFHCAKILKHILRVGPVMTPFFGPIVHTCHETDFFEKKLVI